jgi:phage gpG-like protein
MNATFFKDFLKDVKTELMDEFDRNFERKGFFDQPWKGTKFPNKRGSLMMRTGALRRSLKGTVQGNAIRFTSSLPYAAIHNEGGTITVTAKMIRYFWAMYRQKAGAVTYAVKSKAMSNTKRNTALTAEAGFFKAMALKPIGSKIKIEERRFIGPHRKVDEAVKTVFDRSAQQINDYIKSKFKK